MEGVFRSFFLVSFAYFFNFFQLFGLLLASTGWKTEQNSFMHDIFCVVLDLDCQLKLSKNRYVTTGTRTVALSGLNRFCNLILVHLVSLS